MKIPLSYIAGALLFGLIAAFGISAMTYHPLPVQVQVNQYAPIKAPEPAIPTIVQTPVPKDPFAPAPAPVIVTTQPLPAITPEPMASYRCDVDPNSPAIMSNCIFPEVWNVFAAMLPLATLSVTLSFLVTRLVGISNRFRWD